MAARKDAARNPRTASQQIILLASKLLQQTRDGTTPSLSPLDLAAADRASNELLAQAAEPGLHTALLQSFGGTSGQRDGTVAALLALLSLALRQSSNFATGEGCRPTYARIREALVGTLSILWKRDSVFCPKVLGPAILGTGTLQCYSLLFADAAKQLKPAAVLQFPASSDSCAATAFSQHGHGPQAAATTPEQWLRTRGYLPKPRGLHDTHRLLCEMVAVVGLMGVSATKDAANGTSSSAVSSGSSPGGGGGGGTAAHSVAMIGEQLQSCWVLEHWARVLLLGTEGAIAAGDSEQCRAAQAVQVDLLQQLYNMLGSVRLDAGLTNMVRRPCSCALAATHMARLCAALDGGHAFGTARPAQLLLPACSGPDTGHLQRPSPAAVAYDSGAVQRCRAVSLLPAVRILGAWESLLGGGLPPVQPDPDEKEAQEDGDQDGEGRTAGEAHAGGDTLEPLPAGSAPWCGTEDPGISRLPPYNRSATVTLCLRLAKGVLARWGGELPDGVRLHMGPISNSSGSGGTPLLPRVGGCAVLYHALACSRLALLPDVRGREEVRGRTRAQLRAWWETYVAAAQHPEALAVGVPAGERAPSEQEDTDGPPVRPSADTVAALAAGVLPCLTLQVTRMGAGSGGGAVCMPPLRYPAVDLPRSEVLLFGPLGQVGELLAAVGRRVRLAAGELRAVAARGAAGTPGGSGGGRSMEWLAEVAGGVTELARNLLDDLNHQVYDGVGVEPVNTQRTCGSVPVTEERQTVAATAAAPGSKPAGSKGAEAARFAVRWSYAVAELLPAVSQAVQTCAPLCLGAARGAGQEGGLGGTAGRLGDLMWELAPSGVAALESAILLLAAHSRAAAAGSGGAAGPGARGASFGPGSGASLGVGSWPGRGAGDTPWRQLLLREVRLMELLGAVLQLFHAACTEDEGPPCVLSLSGPLYATLVSPRLLTALPLAAAAFPAEFREAVGVKAGGSGSQAAAAAEPAGAAVAVAVGAQAMGSRSQAAAAAEPAGAARGAAGPSSCAGGSGSGRGDAPKPSIPLAVLRAVMAKVARTDQLQVVEHVVEGWDPSPEEARIVCWELACSLWRCDDAAVYDRIGGMLSGVLAPAEARAAVAAAVATEAVGGA